jgi:2-oxoglutarate ferredoxin oxidoreductase subunit gamma
MQNDLICAGFGGQGVLLIGKILAYAGMHEGKEVVWFPSYGPEMRGGTANCSVVISDRAVGSPIIAQPRGLIAMNLPSLDLFEPKVKPGGLIIVNTSLINRSVERTDVVALELPCNAMATEAGTPRAANMVALGAYVGMTDAVALKEAEELVRETFGKKPKLVDVNLKALHVGHEFALAHRGGCKATREVRA